MANQVLLNDEDIIEIHVVGDQNIASIELMGREASVLLSKLRARDKRCLILDDLLEMGAVDADGRKLVVELGKTLDYDKLAMVGKGGVLRLGTNLLLKAIGKAGRIRYFDDRQEALNWLRQA